jgi:O-antigen/teichoic acid export membrane protein
MLFIDFNIKMINSIIQLLPIWIRSRLDHNWDKEGFKKYFFNTGWIFVAKITTFIVSFFTIAIVARYLGPENLGKISYAQSFVAIFSALASLGIDQILYRDLVAKPDKEGELLGTAIATKLIFGFITLITATIVAWQINTDPILTWLIAIISLTFILQPFGSVSQVFSAKVQSKYPSYVSIVIAFLMPALKLLVIFFDKGILFFAGIIAFEALFYSLANFYLYKYLLKRSVQSWKFSLPVFKQLFRDSWPLVLAGITGYMYARIDQVMLQHYLNSTSVGLYDAAVRLTELLGFLPGVIIGSLFPAIINARKNDMVQYRKRLHTLVIFCITISAISASLMYILSPYIIKILFGVEFNESINLTRIYVWSTLGTVATSLMYSYFVAENRSYLFLIFTFSGAFINVLLNMIMIPKYGTVGAAYATIITLTSTVTLFMICRKRLIESDIKPTLN